MAEAAGTGANPAPGLSLSLCGPEKGGDLRRVCIPLSCGGFGHSWHQAGLELACVARRAAISAGSAALGNVLQIPPCSCSLPSSFPQGCSQKASHSPLQDTFFFPWSLKGFNYTLEAEISVPKLGCRRGLKNPPCLSVPGSLSPSGLTPTSLQMDFDTISDLKRSR